MGWNNALNNSRKWFFKLLFVGSILIVLSNIILLIFSGISYFEQKEAFELCMKHDLKKLEPRHPAEPDCFDIFYDSNFFFGIYQLFNIFVAIFVGSYAYGRITSEDLSLRHESATKKVIYLVGCVVLILFLVFYLYAYITLFRLMNLGIEALENTKETDRNLLD